MKEKYEYEGLKLRPGIFKELLILLFDGKQFTRQTAISTISKYHVEQGGIIEEGRDLTSAFKNATQNLKKMDAGIVNKSYGTWELHYKIKETIEVVEEKQTNEKQFLFDESIGEGTNAVYVYYYDIYKSFAEIKGEKCWPCKVGRTDRDPIQRVFGQAGTCYPQLPHIALIIYCDDSSALESALHSILKFQNKWMKDAPGTEWFMTSPEEIKDFYLSILS